MTQLINGRTPEQHSAWNRWHAIIAALLALLLLILWFSGKGPGFATSSGSCCGTPTPVAATPVAPVAEPAAAAPVDSDGDGDGVTDDLDRCPGTPQGERVGEYGCPCDVTVQLQYELDSAALTAADKAALDGVAALLDELKFETGEVGGYADSTGDDQYNVKLSLERAQSAIDYLVTKGIAAGRLTAVGYGEANPIADNATEEGRALNRRAVFRRSDCGPAPSAAAPVAPVPSANLYFDVDKSDLPTNAAETLVPIVDYLNANPTAMAVISGYHDPTGDREHNLELSKNRAFAVRDFLVKSGVTEARFDMAKPIETTGSGDLQQARRVEVGVKP